ncbi:hypothetical protein [Candidatus Oscillochloris fontis]|uniref:hypothetical protein n=1 Tax=Candidatus Oscillochloris fontis TaxID=2496868 RepID=UPI00101B66EC|nr:hypothetical protein [Candidatus Oscillochloris fontis]
MALPRTHTMLKQEIDDLNESDAQEVLDFLLFIKARRAEEAFLWQQVEEVQHRRQADPGAVQTVDVATWDLLTAHLDEQES